MVCYLFQNDRKNCCIAGQYKVRHGGCGFEQEQCYVVTGLIGTSKAKINAVKRSPFLLQKMGFLLMNGSLLSAQQGVVFEH